MSHSELHVVLCTDGVFPHAMGGMQRHSRLLAEHLAKAQGIRLTVIHPHKEVVFDPSLGIAEVRIADIDTSKLYLRELWRYSGRVASELDELKPDIILSQGFCVWKGIRRFSDRLIVHPHGLEMFQGLTWKDRLVGAPFRRVLRYIIRRASRVISLGGRITGTLQAMALGSHCRVVEIPNAVMLPGTPAAYPAEQAPVRLLFVGRFAFNKGLDVLLAVASRLVLEGRSEDVRFQLAGDGPLLERMERQALSPNVELLGRVDDVQLDRLYAGSHALLLPTRFEGMPTVVLEAMARSRPILVSDVGATAELVDTGNGYLLPPGDADALFKAVLGFCRLSGEAKAGMGRRSHQRIVERFTWQAVAQQFTALFAEVAADHAIRPSS